MKQIKKKKYNNKNTIFLSSISHYKGSSIIVMNKKKEYDFYLKIFFIRMKKT